MSVHVIRIPGWKPSRTNELLEAHWRLRSRMKAEDATMLAAFFFACGGIRATGKRRIDLRVVVSGSGRTADPDAYWKSLLDGLVRCGALKDDSSACVELGTVSIERGADPCTEITLTDIGETQ